MDNAVQAIMMAFGVFVLVIALSIAVYMFTQVTSIAENLLYFADRTNYYESMQDIYNNENISREDRYVDLDTIIPTLYRYYKENFCVKIYDATDSNATSPKLVQIFDVDLENNVGQAVRDEQAKDYSVDSAKKINYALKKIYNDDSKEKKKKSRLFY